MKVAKEQASEQEAAKLKAEQELKAKAAEEQAAKLKAEQETAAKAADQEAGRQKAEGMAEEEAAASIKSTQISAVQGSQHNAITADQPSEALEREPTITPDTHPSLPGNANESDSMTTKGLSSQDHEDDTNELLDEHETAVTSREVPKEKVKGGTNCCTACTIA
jgi:hypothetical protein